MKNFRLFALIFLCSTSLMAQFSIEEYKKYLSSHKDMTVEQLLTEYPAGKFLQEAPTDFLKADYADSIMIKYKLTEYEKSLIAKHGFMVSERLNHYNFVNGFWDVYKKDLPIYISSDAMLHALHYNFDYMVKTCEYSLLSRSLKSAISKMKSNLKNLTKANAPIVYVKALNDLDIYLTVTETLLLGKSSCEFTENKNDVSKIISLINNRMEGSYQLFSSTNRAIDFSQFTPRGHYTVFDNDSTLHNYFLAMMWLGRTDIIISNPTNDLNQKHSDEDLQRMAILSALMAETAFQTKADSDLFGIEAVLSFLMGSQDNIAFTEVMNTLKSLSINSYDLIDKDKCKLYVDKLRSLSSATQLYNSQILYSNPDDPNQVEPPSVFLLMGQRPIIDGYITANVVYDRIINNNTKIRRMVPSTQDILFAIGNDASVQLLQDELTKYPYSSNLASLRYLVDSYDNDFWKSSTYTCWMNTLRSLNPPKQRWNLPKFMQTAAWWQKTMNTQLASWAELRHDFLLYAKQPYTESIMCSYPHAYVEPVPEFYTKLMVFFESIKGLANIEYIKNTGLNGYLIGLSNQWIPICEKLKSMSEKELLGQEFSQTELDFICSTVKEGKVCNPDNSARDLGWYLKLYGLTPELFYGYYDGVGKGFERDQFTVADVHTIPTDAGGNPVGWVLHAGTGRINMAVITVPTNDGGTRAYVGPVSSYYEFISNDFKRLTNEEWRTMDGAPAYRPTFTNLYLANKEGNEPIGEKVSLQTIPVSVGEDRKSDANGLNLTCAPNPFSHTTIISFTIPNSQSDINVDLSIYDLKGTLVKSIINQKLFSNNFSFLWDGTDNDNLKVTAGTYICTIKTGNIIFSQNINMIK